MTGSGMGPRSASDVYDILSAIIEYRRSCSSSASGCQGR